MSEPKITSRAYAEKLRRIATYLDSRDEFELDYEHSSSLSFYSKDKFVTAVKAVGSSKKSYGTGEYASLNVTPLEFSELILSIQRDKVCKKVVKFECEPLFSEGELNSL